MQALWFNQAPKKNSAHHDFKTSRRGSVAHTCATLHHSSFLLSPSFFLLLIKFTCKCHILLCPKSHMTNMLKLAQLTMCFLSPRPACAPTVPWSYVHFNTWETQVQILAYEQPGVRWPRSLILAQSPRSKVPELPLPCHMTLTIGEAFVTKVLTG